MIPENITLAMSPISHNFYIGRMKKDGTMSDKKDVTTDFVHLMCKLLEDNPNGYYVTLNNIENPKEFVIKMEEVQVEDEKEE
jgi:hypothetical protein